MSLPLENYEPLGPLDDRLLDRLVDGEVPDVDRRGLLLRLESEPEGWRRCALAFLEAQSWHEALKPLAGAAGARPTILRDRQGRKPRPSYRIAALTTLAASVVAAFALGWVLHLQPTQPTQEASVADGSKSAPPANVEGPQPAPIDPASEPSRSRKPGETHVRVDPFVQKMEQRGFRAQTQERLLSMKLKDGRKLDVPVQEVRLWYVRNRTY
jgi:hypothetical protein